MGSTTWRDLFRPDPRTWLLTDGTVIAEPPLEETSTGRKIRVKGTTLSVFHADLEQLLTSAADTAARQKQTSVWIPLNGMAEAVREQERQTRVRIGDDDDLFGDRSSNYPALKLVWRFRHPTLPVEAFVRAEVVDSDASGIAGAKKYLTFLVETVDTEPTGTSAYSFTVNGDHVGPQHTDYTTNKTAAAACEARFPELSTLLKTFHPSQSGYGSTSYWRGRAVGPLRKTVKDLLKIVQHMEDLDEFYVPDLRIKSSFAQPASVPFLELKRVSSNVTDSVVSRLQEIVQSAGNSDKLLATYTAFRQELSHSGLVLPQLDTDGLAAIANGTQTATITVSTLDNASRREKHGLALNLLTGEFRVGCPVGDDGAIQAWNEAHTIAELTGQAKNFDTFLTEYARTSAADRLGK